MALVSASPSKSQRLRSVMQAERYTRRLALSHYENFVVGGMLTPKRLRQDFYNVYAYCRTADDLADNPADPQARLAKLEQWEQWLDDCYAQQRVLHPVFKALRQTIDRHEIPDAPFRQLLVAFRRDQTQTTYDTLDQLLEYCASSANPVGHMVLYLADAYNDRRAELSSSICTGLQLANFCQDVRRDAQMGRTYIPGEDLGKFQISREDLGLPKPPERGQEMLKAQVDRAESFLRGGLPLVNDVPRWLGRNVRLFVGGGLAILKAIRKSDYDVWTQRPVVRRHQQARLFMTAWLGIGTAR